jgi:hypothetical protein
MGKAILIIETNRIYYNQIPEKVKIAPPLEQPLRKPGVIRGHDRVLATAEQPLATLYIPIRIQPQLLRKRPKLVTNLYICYTHRDLIYTLRGVG